MKIVFLHNDFKVYWRGRLIFLKNFFSDLNIEMDVIEIFGRVSSYTFDQTEMEYNWWHCLFQTENIGELSKKEVNVRILQKLNQLDPDIIICGPVAFTSGAIGTRWAVSKKRKLILFDDSKHSHYKRNWFTNFVKIKLTDLADAIVVPSKEYLSEYKYWGINTNKLYFGLNCIDNDYFSRTESQKGKSTKKFVFIGRLVAIKNLDSLFLVWSNLGSKTNNYELLIVGDGPSMEELLAIKRNLKLENIKFLGFQNKEEIAKILKTSEVLVLPSFREGWAMVVNEAMAASLPVLLSKYVNAGHTLLQPGINGFDFDPYNVNSLETAILKYISLPEIEKNEFSTQSKILVSKFTYQYLGNELLRAIKNITSSNSKKHTFLDKILVYSWGGKFQTSNWDTIK